jgi:hypothetical protein
MVFIDNGVKRNKKMKIIITEKQHKLIVEALGVPDSILDAAEEFYDIFLNKIKDIKLKRDKYEFEDSVDIVLGDKTKINIDEYVLEVSVREIEEFDETAKVASMGMGQGFTFDRTIYMKRIEETRKAVFAINYIVRPDWDVNELYDEFKKDRVDHIASLAHELKHFYDKQVKKIDLIGKDAEYQSIFESPRFDIPVIDNEFLKYTYYTNVAENLVRATEVASNLRSQDIKKSQFREFLKQNRTYKTLTELKDFTYEKLIEGLYEKMDRIDEIAAELDMDPESMTTEEKIDFILRLVYINLGNAKMRLFDKYTEDRSLLGMFSLFGFNDSKDEKMDNVRNQFVKHISKYEKNPIQFFKNEIKKFHIVADKMIRKIAKLYSMAKDDAPAVKESIIDWELHSKLLQKGKIKLTYDTELIKKKS